MKVAPGLFCLASLLFAGSAWMAQIPQVMNNFAHLWAGLVAFLSLIGAAICLVCAVLYAIDGSDEEKEKRKRSPYR